jgi:diguanylate cyclase (GGDEF)-like protein
MDLEGRFMSAREGRWSKWWAEARSLTNSQTQTVNAGASAGCTCLDSAQHADASRTDRDLADRLNSEIIRGVLKRSSAHVVILDSSYRILAAGQAFQNAVCPSFDLVGSCLIDLLEPVCRERARAFFRNLAESPETIELEVIVPPDGTIRARYWCCRTLTSAGPGIVAVGQDLEDPRILVDQVARFLEHEPVDAETEEESESNIDRLTGLGNRRVLFERMDTLWRDTAELGAVAWVMIADLDRFKRVNEVLGKDGGDAVLRAIANVLRNSVRGGDWVCRYGGDEFLLAGTCRSELEMPGLAGRILTAIRNLRFDEGDKRISVTVSLGAALAIPGGSYQPSAVLQAADRAIRRAKEAGRDRYDVEPGILGDTQRAEPRMAVANG